MPGGEGGEAGAAVAAKAVESKAEEEKPTKKVGDGDGEPDAEFVEWDPSGRFGRVRAPTPAAKIPLVLCNA
jgi:hypothetical protein